MKRVSVRQRDKQRQALAMDAAKLIQRLEASNAALAAAGRTLRMRTAVMFFATAMCVVEAIAVWVLR